MQEYPAPFKAVAQSMRENCAVSSVLVLNKDTSAVELGAFGGQGLAIRWIPRTETPTVSPFSSVVASGLGANYDHYVPPSQYRRFVVPIEVSGQNAGGNVGSVNGLYFRLAVVNAGTTASSLMAAEY